MLKVLTFLLLNVATMNLAPSGHELDLEHSDEDVVRIRNLVNELVISIYKHGLLNFIRFTGSLG